MMPPRTLSPSKVTTFTQCALKFRYTAIDRLTEPPSPAATKGTLVHAALERLFSLDPHLRTTEAAHGCLDEAVDWIRGDEDFTGLGFDPADTEAFFADARVLVDNYLSMEDPTRIRPIGIEVMLEVPRNGYALRGVIDRLELGPDGELIVTDYKTGRAPPDRFAQRRMDGVKLYASMCAELLGRTPDKVQLLFLRDRTIVEARPSARELSGMNRRVDAVWHAVARACDNGDFRPKPSRLCDWCSFKVHCPAFDGALLPAPVDAASV